MRLVRLGLVLLAAAGMVLPQTFEVASIRLSGPKSVRGSDGGPGSKDPGRYTFGQADLQILMMIAWQVEPFQISSRFPLDKEAFDLVAEIPQGATKQQFRVMLQNFLVERFHLKLHSETRDFPAYELIVARSGPKLNEASAQSVPAPKSWLAEHFPDLAPNRPGMVSSNSMLPGGSMLVRIKAQQQPVSQLARSLRSAEDRPVVDRTGLAGNFDFILEYSRENPNPSTDTSPSAFPDLNAALRNQLGLQLVATKLPFEVLVIDSVDRLPVEN